MDIDQWAEEMKSKLEAFVVAEKRNMKENPEHYPNHEMAAGYFDDVFSLFLQDSIDTWFRSMR